MCPSDDPQSQINKTALLRVLDAAANRASEGLRVVEDYVRFVLDDADLTRECKQLRHDLAAVLALVSIEPKLAARETLADVGTALSTVSKQSRLTTEDVVTANFNRAEQALRSLEEFSKVSLPDVAPKLECLRYRTYTLQRAIGLTAQGLRRLGDVKLLVLVDGRESEDEFSELVRLLLGAGVKGFELRDKQLADRPLLSRAKLLRSFTQEKGALFILNDRPDLARLTRADGVHLGQDDVSVKDARTVVGPDALIGVSAHSVEQARQAVLEGANYIGVGPTFPSETKAFEKFTGVELLRALSSEIRLPAFAIGGINSNNLAQVMATGFSRVAISAAIIEAVDPATVAKELLQRLQFEATSSL